MARATRIYLVHPKNANEPILATFTVKSESQCWAEQSVHGIENLERTSMRDGGDSKFIGTRVLVPWVVKEQVDEPFVICDRCAYARAKVEDECPNPNCENGWMA